MIVEIIRKPGEKGSGGTAEAFLPGIRYVWQKATHVETRNLAATDWYHAATEMRLVSELNRRVQKPYYHLAASWHAQEQPSDAQQMAAAEHLIEALGLQDHQSVIAIHRDKAQAHFHIVVNTVHPVTGKVWSKSNDHMRVEKACREIEVLQGWSHDRGQFDFDIAPDGSVRLKPAPEAYERKKVARAKGKRPKTSGDRKYEKSTGFETFEHSLTDALRDRFAAAVATSSDWQSLHAALLAMGLRYDKHGSGARVLLMGSGEHLKASAFGAKFSISKLQKRLGPYEAPPQEQAASMPKPPAPIAGMSGLIAKEDRKYTSASSFKLTLLRRIYCGIHIDPLVAQAIKFVGLAEVPPRITLRDTTTLLDYGERVTTSGDTKEARAIMIAMAKAKGWSAVRFTGPPEFVRAASLEAAQAGLPISGVPEDLQTECDAILARLRAQETKIEAVTKGVALAAQEAVADHDAARAKSGQARAERDAEKAAHLRELEDVLKALKPYKDPASRAVKRVAQDEKRQITAAFRGERGSTNAISAKDADQAGSAKGRRIARTLRDHDETELARMKEVPIDVIATLGGWTFTPRHKDGHNDPKGHKLRTYTRGPETIKATRKGPHWVWTNNKTGGTGSVIDLWQADNPGSTLGDARKAFRQLIGTDGPAPMTPRDRALEEPRDHTQARRRWEEAPYIEDRRTYAEDRGISKATLLRFCKSVRAGVYGGIYFAHRHPDTGDILGFEQAWEKDGIRNTARFAKGGVKTVSVLGDPKAATRMVVLEGGLDALALAEIEARCDTLYVSTGGGFGQRTEQALKTLADGRQVVSGFDNDPAGEALHAQLSRLLPTAQRHAPPARIEGNPRPCKDWLDVLNAVAERGNVEPEREADGSSQELTVP